MFDESDASTDSLDCSATVGPLTTSYSYLQGSQYSGGTNVCIQQYRFARSSPKWNHKSSPESSRKRMALIGKKLRPLDQTRS